ncbi:Glycosyl transferase, group 1 [Euzebya pacifica]|uniref:Glycosyl transferase, group 1 n=1 Tax=Euzebya pacifica TaxID=1608957 RepID=A0A346XVL6_9ACTN|nr:glycosyltransferase family 4 protein [Euzebya pacifica]AXV06263.1 Glycosyl transferase, group 1 [Euzebya pacifica]
MVSAAPVHQPRAAGSPADAARPLRIAIIAALRHGLREPHAGGLERQTADLAHGLRAAGNGVTVFASADADPDLGVEPIVPRETLLDLSPAAREDVSMLAEGFMVEHDAYLDLMLRLRDADFDVVHDNSLHYIPPATADLLPMPVVKVLHTPPTPWIEAALRRRPENLHVVSVSHDNARRWPITPRAVIHNAIDLDRFEPTGAPVPRSAVWVGRVCPEKGPHHAVRAARRAGFSLDVIGPASDPTYAEEVLRPELDDHRRWVGHLDSADVAARIARASVALVTPCWPEPFGLVVMEALACGTPVAGYRHGALPELVNDDVAVLVDPDDEDGLAEAVLQASTLDRGRCRAHAVAHGSVERMTGDYLALYRELVS